MHVHNEELDLTRSVLLTINFEF